METSLDELVKSMRKSGLQDDFVHTTRHFGRNELFLKGIYPYEHMTDATKFDETELPAKSAFYNRLCGEHVSEKKHERAKEIWAHFAMKTLQEYHTFYLVLDVLLLADVFEKFRRTMLDSHGFNCLHLPSMPSMTLQLALKVTGVELELISDPNIYLMIESGIRGGLSYVAQRHAAANFPEMPDYRPDQLPPKYSIWIVIHSIAHARLILYPSADSVF